jgi:hypothetical protein
MISKTDSISLHILHAAYACQGIYGRAQENVSVDVWGVQSDGGCDFARCEVRGFWAMKAAGNPIETVLHLAAPSGLKHAKMTHRVHRITTALAGLVERYRPLEFSIR